MNDFSRDLNEITAIINSLYKEKKNHKEDGSTLSNFKI